MGVDRNKQTNMQRLKAFTSKYMSNSLMVLTIAALLSACGGGLGLNPDPIVKKSIDVTSVNVKPFTENEKPKEEETGQTLFYGGKVIVTINGKNLDAEPLTVRFPGCSGLEEPAEGTGEKRVYTCTLKK